MMKSKDFLYLFLIVAILFAGSMFLVSCNKDETPGPSITSVSTNHALPGETVTITGVNLLGGGDAVTTSHLFKINGTVAVIQAGSTNTEVVITVPAGSTTGKITIEKSGGTVIFTSTEDFDVLIDLPRNGLVAFYPYTGNVNDVSGNSLHGTLGAGATAPAPGTDRFGKANQTYTFDGVDDYITMGNPDKLKINDVITVSAWIKVDAIKTKAQPFLSKLYYNAQQYTFRVGLDVACESAPHFSFQYHSGNSRMTNTVTHMEVITPGTWVHFVLVLEHYNSRFYKNGVLINDSGYGGDVFGFGTQLGEWMVGTGETTGLAGPYSFFQGSVDDIAIYNRGLTAAEALQLYQQTISKY